MPEVISRYRAQTRKNLPQVYKIRNAGSTVHVNTDSFPKITSHRPGNPEKPEAYRFRQTPQYRNQMAAVREELKQANNPPYSILDDQGKPSWKRNWWERNRHTIKPHAVAVGIGIGAMLLALLMAECGAGHANAATAVGNAPAAVLDVSNGSAGGPVPAPMPRRFVTPEGRICLSQKFLGEWPWGPLLRVGSGSSASETIPDLSAPKNRTLELRLPEERCALKTILVGDDISVQPPGE